jgi:hypothetical protein
MIASTFVIPTPPTSDLATQDTPLPDAPTTAPMETEGWRTVEGKATQRKRKNEIADKIHETEKYTKPLIIQNGRWGKKHHQLTKTNTRTKKTWADVIKNGGINVQIVLGNGNLRLTILMKMRGERQAGAA